MGYVLHDAPAVCTILPRNTLNARIPALLFTDFDVGTNGDITTAMATNDGGSSITCTVTTPAVGTQFHIDVTGVVAATRVIDGLVESELTDNVPPNVPPVDKATTTVQVNLDEPGRVYVVGVVHGVTLLVGAWARLCVHAAGIPNTASVLTLCMCRVLCHPQARPCCRGAVSSAGPV